MRALQILALIALYFACAEAGQLRAQLLRVHHVTSEQYKELQRLTQGHFEVPEGRLIGSAVTGIKGLAAGLKTGLAAGIVPGFLNYFGATQSPSTKEGYPLCVISASDLEVTNNGDERSLNLSNLNLSNIGLSSGSSNTDSSSDSDTDADDNDDTTDPGTVGQGPYGPYGPYGPFAPGPYGPGPYGTGSYGPGPYGPPPYGPGPYGPPPYGPGPYGPYGPGPYGPDPSEQSSSEQSSTGQGSSGQGSSSTSTSSSKGKPNVNCILIVKDKNESDTPTDSNSNQGQVVNPPLPPPPPPGYYYRPPPPLPPSYPKTVEELGRDASMPFNYYGYGPYPFYYPVPPVSPAVRDIPAPKTSRVKLVRGKQAKKSKRSRGNQPRSTYRTVSYPQLDYALSYPTESRNFGTPYTAPIYIQIPRRQKTE